MYKTSAAYRPYNIEMLIRYTIKTARHANGFKVIPS